MFDLAWAPDASALLSGSIENICVLWDVDAGKSRLRLENHSHFVQGVAWDPARQFLASQSADRSCRCGPARCRMSQLHSESATLEARELPSCQSARRVESMAIEAAACCFREPHQRAL